MLSFDQAPPISATFRFFLTAPWFGVAAGLMLAWDGPAALVSRWTPATLALTHLLTAGFMLQAMCGALLQLIPVLAGGNVGRPLLLARLLHPTLVAGALTLAYCLADTRTRLLPVSEFLLGGGLGAFCVAVGIALSRSSSTGVSLAPLRAAVLGLAVTTLLGLLLAQVLSGRAAISLPDLANLHAAWGLGGWALMLLAGVSFTVVPMLQMTPPYPTWLPRLFVGTLEAALILALPVVFARGQAQAWILAIAVAVLSAMGFALTTLWLQHRRRGVRVDATLAFSRGAMLALIAASACWLAATCFPELAARPWMTQCIGILCLVGVFVSAISGMLYKIVPFIGWLKLPYRRGSSAAPPSIAEFITGRAMNAQMRLHFGTLALLLASLAIPQLTRPAGLAFAVSCGWLGANLIGGLRIYARLKDQSCASAEVHGS